MGLTALQQKVLNELFYYDAQSIAVTYSNDATGELDVDRLIEQKPFWKSIIASTSKKPKKVIINDWSMLARINEESQKLWLLLLSEGIKQGVEFYLWTGQLIKVSSIREFFNALPNLISIPYQALINQLPNYKISKDEIVYIDILNSSMLEKHLCCNKYKKKECNDFMVLNFFKDENIDKFMQLFSTINPNTKLNLDFQGHILECVILEEILKSDYEITGLKIKINDVDACNKLINLIKSYPVKFQTINECTLEIGAKNTRLFNILLDAIPNVETLKMKKVTLSDMDLASKNLSKLKKLSVESDRVYTPVLKSIPASVQILELFRITINDWRKANLQFPNVETITFKDCDYTIFGYNVQVMKIFPNLKVLNSDSLLKIRFTTNQFADMQVSYPNIEVLETIIEISRVDVVFSNQTSNLKAIQLGAGLKNDEIHDFLLNHPNVVKLSIKHDSRNIICDGSFINFSGIEQLEYLELNELDLGKVNLEDFFAHAKNLRHLCLIDCYNLTLPKNESLQLMNLQQLVIKTNPTRGGALFLSPEEYNDFIHMFPNLESFEIPESNFNMQHLKMKQSFPNLKKMKVADSYVPSVVFQNFIDSTPLIEEIELYNLILQNHLINDVDFKEKYIYIKEGWLNWTLSDKELLQILPQLRNVNGLSLTFSKDFQGTFINHYKNIIPVTCLTLKGACNNRDCIDKLLNSIPNLLEFSTNHLDTDLWLIHSLRKAPNLEKLNLKGVRLSPPAFMTALIYIASLFPDLESIDFDDDLLTVEIINQLLKIENITPALRTKLESIKNKSNLQDIEHDDFGLNSMNQFYGQYVSEQTYTPNTFTQNNNNINLNIALNKMPHLTKSLIEQRAQPTEKDLMNIIKQTSHFDSITKLNNTNMSTRSIFSKKTNGFPDESDYRLIVISTMLVSEKISFPPTKANIEITALKQTQNVLADYKKTYAQENDIYHGQLTIDLEEDEWYPLPSLSANDSLKALESNAQLTIGYCEEQKLYYVKSATGEQQHNVNISFMIHSSKATHPQLYNYPLAPLKAKAETLFKNLSFNTKTGELEKNDSYHTIMALSETYKLNLLFAYCNFEKVEELGNQQEYKNDIERLNAIIHERKGVCRHRAWTFKAIADSIGIQTRIVINDIHAYVEVLYDDKWIRKDLGGGQANVNKLNPNAAQNIELEKEIKEAFNRLVNDDQQPNPPKDIKQLNPSAQNLLQPQTKAQKISPTPTTPHKPMHDNPFARWNTVKTTATKFNEYMDQLLEQARSLADNKRNILIMLEPEEIEPFYAACSKYFADKEKKSFNLNNFQDIAEKTIKVAPDGSYEKVNSDLMTLLNDAKHDDALIVNWSSYGPADVGHNSIIDDKRKLRSNPIKDGVFVINVLDKTKANRIGEDFYSRMRLTSQSPPLTSINRYKELIKLQPNDVEDEHKIEFYDQDWKKDLLGQIQLAGRKLQIEHCGLIKALKAKANKITLVNPPDHLPEFRYFMADLLIKRKLTFNGEVIEIPEDFNVEVVRKHYSLKDKNLNIRFTNQIADTDYLINRDTYLQLFTNKRCVNNELFMNNGLLAKHKDQTISLYITEYLTIEQWCKIVSEANKSQCTLDIKCHPNMTIPTLPIKKDENAIKPQVVNENIMVANDLEFAEHLLIKKYPKATVISIDKTSLYQDIIESTQLANKDTEDLVFANRESDIWQRIQKGETIILKGNISKQLANKLNTLLLDPPYAYVNGKKTYLEGKLILLTENQDILPHIKHENLHSVRNHHWQALTEAYVKNEADQTLLNEFKQDCQTMELATGISFSYGQLRAMYLKLQSGNKSNPFKPYFRLYPDAKLATAKEIWQGKKPAKDKNVDVLTKRRAKLEHEFKNSNYLFIAGPSGVGKTTYMLDYFKEALNITIHPGIERLKEWLEQGGALFIDEANIEQEGSWDILEGIFNQTPNILLDGKIYPITDKHKILFAGNYGHFAGRYKHKFIERHGQVFNFKELPDSFLKENILQRAIKENFPTIKPEQATEITDTLLSIYNTVNTLDQSHPLTPRNLKMMVAKLGYFAKEHNSLLENYSLPEVAAFIALDEVFGAVKEGARFVENSDLLKLHEELTTKLNSELQNKYGNFTVTESRVIPTRILNDQILLREGLFKGLPNTILSGILLEGVAGIGKSTMAMELLKSYGYQDVTTTVGPVDGAKSYYHLTPTDPGEMEKILIKAFHEGAIVIIDELNSLPLEKVINQLLTGKDMKGKEATHKGFMLIATQNPVNYTGRQVLSKALENRFYKIDLPDYKPKELYQICCSLYPNEALVSSIIDDYIAAKEYARLKNLSPAPTPRDLFNYVIQRKNAKTTNAKVSSPFAFKPNADQSTNEDISKFELEDINKEIASKSKDSELTQQNQTPEEILKKLRINLADLRKAVNTKRRMLEINVDLFEDTDKRNIYELKILSDKIYETILDIMHYETKYRYRKSKINDYKNALERFTNQAATYLAIPSNEMSQKSADSNVPAEQNQPEINQQFKERETTAEKKSSYNTANSMWQTKDEKTNQNQTTIEFKENVKKQ